VGAGFLPDSGVWQTSDVGFTQAQLRAADTVVSTILGQSDPPELILLGGDRAIGLGLVNSTVDMYVVGTLRTDIQPSQEIDGTRIRIRVLTEERATELIRLATDYRATRADSEQLSTCTSQMRQLLQLVTGRRLVVSPRWAAELDAISGDVIRQMLISRAALAFAACAVDAFDALLSGDLFTAVTISAAGLFAGCEAAVASAGDLAVGAEFVFRRAARNTVTAPWCGYLWRLLNWSFPGAELPPPSLVKAIVEERLLAANMLLAWCSLDGWDSKLEALPEPTVRSSAPDTGLKRSPYFTPVRFADAWTLLGPGQGYLTTENVVRLWRRLDGQQPGNFDLTECERAIAGMSMAEAESIMTTLRHMGAADFAGGHAENMNGTLDAPVTKSNRFELTARAGWELAMVR
jgi:hypothetical protein